MDKSVFTFILTLLIYCKELNIRKIALSLYSNKKMSFKCNHAVFPKVFKTSAEDEDRYAMKFLDFCPFSDGYISAFEDI